MAVGLISNIFGVFLCNFFCVNLLRVCCEDLAMTNVRLRWWGRKLY